MKGEPGILCQPDMRGRHGGFVAVAGPEIHALLLRRRLEERQAPIRVVRVGRGRVRLEATGPLRLDAAPD